MRRRSEALRSARLWALTVASAAVLALAGGFVPATAWGAPASAATEASPEIADPADYGGDTTEDEAQPGGYAGPEGFQTMSLVGWKAGNIISDAKMFASGTMSATQIQTFLNGRVPKCQSGYVCLKDYKQNTITKAATRWCPGTYQGVQAESAAAIISKAAKACGVNEQVLLVMLQKEQGLVTHVWPSDWRYTIAMGYACPDNAACDTAYYGFQNQIYMAASQLKRYTLDSWFNWYPVGKTSPVRWHPNAACGSGSVLIENKATAALYYYTPYQPNAAALRAGYGEGDSCSAYGNRNFYNYFTDWFGPTRTDGSGAGNGYSVAGAIGDKWRALGGRSSKLGGPTSAEKCGLVAGGCWQSFEHGRIYWAPATGAFATSGAIQTKWVANNSENGRLGYPLTDETCGLPSGGCYQKFQGGQIHWTQATGAQVTRGGILSEWGSQGYERGKLGYPVSDEICGLRGNGCYQKFQGGTIHWTQTTGAHATWGDIKKAWASLSAENGVLGYPTSGEICGLKGSGCYQKFQRGTIHWSPATGAHATRGGIKTTWGELGAENGKLGYPVSAQVCGLRGNGCYQKFQGGNVHVTATTGAHATWGGIKSAWASTGNENGRLGYPTTGETCGSAGTCTQRFQWGTISWNPVRGSWITYR